MLPCTLVHQRPGSSSAIELTTVESGLTFDTAAVGGFGSLEATLPGDFRKSLSYLGRIQVFFGSTLLWEGQLEDQSISFNTQSQTTTVRAFGLQRKLSETSVRRVWSKRDIAFAQVPGAIGANLANGHAIADMSVDIGSYDPTDLSKKGLRVGGKSVAVAPSTGQGAVYILPSGLTLVRVLGTATLAGTNVGAGKFNGDIESSSTGAMASWASGGLITASGAFNVAIGGNYLMLLALNEAGGSLTPTTADTIDFSDIRILCTSLAEDATGGFYGGTILQDLLALIPGLTAGIIESGSDYTIQAIERSVRDASLSVVQEVAGYYSREWAVWEDGRFDWKTRNLDETQYVIKLEDTKDLQVDVTIDDLARTVYVLYNDAASGLDAEASAAGADQRNPYLRQGITKDALVSPSFPMTASTSAQLAAVLATQTAVRPSASGSVTLPANKMIANAVGAPKPAALIRGGDNVSFPELPKTDVMIQGRDGETLFHVASSEINLDENTVTLELEGQQSRADVLLARLAAATRALTG